ncbi:hypothetical protein [Caulobacter sp.]|uniref:hypothetical protein n=1 Tax=Caulobacter sp. TaxID=78 RepID=UPI001B144632|nr:hypothetical protein [Caulobacter sp.]MBO9545262.1 hypothetical protein [Caulobacter sp.]
MPQRPFDLRTDSIFEPFPKWWGLLFIYPTASLLIIFDQFGLPAIGGMAWISTASLGFAVRNFWPLRREPWFWITMACMAAAHAALIATWPWPDQRLSRGDIVLMFAADIALYVGLVSLVATAIRRARKAA